MIANGPRQPIYTRDRHRVFPIVGLVKPGAVFDRDRHLLVVET